ncbi:MAG TPA: UvrD-helicase domain-containing protein, partial [Longimicrobiales bacterium]|nr:UvrD-helicase domain-containing protein [Longimicrobiales bacterium]
MSTVHPRELVLASAGSGKTYLISSRIIALLAQGVAPATLLASTFTRKAAGEILSRVLGRLADGAWDPEAAGKLGRDTGVPGADRDFWRAVLARTMRAIHELDVGTLDAFFGRAVRSFAHDLGIPAGWTVADEATADRIRAQALESVLDSLGRDPMVELVRGIRGGDVRRSVHEGLSREVDRIVEIHRDLAEDGPGWDALGEVLEGLGVDPAEGRTPGEELEDEEGEGPALAEELLSLPLPPNAGGGVDPRIAAGVEALAGLVREDDWEKAVVHTLFKNARPEGSGKYYGKVLGDDLLDLLRRIAAAATRTLLAEYHRRARAMGRLGAAYDVALDRTLREAGVLRFEDVTRLLAGDHRLAARPELGYRMDGGTKHILLDEFQDTSLIQWRALRPLADALMGPGAPSDGSASVVADPKQSIYGWRGAAPVVVEALEGDAYDLASDTLATSFRSSGVVLDAVNAVFGGIAGAEVFADEEVDRETAALWARHFRPHTPDSRRAGGDFPGRVTLCAGPPRDGTASSQPEFMRYAAERIEALYRAAPDRSLGVLVRRNEAVARLILELRERGVPASEEGGTRLVDSPAVVSVLALLRLADHPGNTLARYHVALTPVGTAVGYTDFRDDEGAAHTALRIRRRLMHRGYGPFLASLREVLLPHCEARDALRLGQLVELGYRHDQRPTLRVDDFVRGVMTARVESGSGNPVRVMTVWGSKGLEFDTVVLPELFQALVG